MEGPIYKDAIDIYKAGLAAANAMRAVARAVVRKDPDTLLVAGNPVDLGKFRKVFVVGAGKAACPMAKALEDALGERLEGGLVVTKYGHAKRLSKVEVVEADHPVPDTRGLSGVRRVMKIVESAGPTDLIFCLLSGGGSALWPLPAEGLSLHEKQTTTDLLLKSGARIFEINAVRKHLSAIKGGHLARAAYPARVISLMLSDVIGDDPAVIASGPASPDPSTFAEALEVLSRHGLVSRVPKPVLAHLEKGRRGEIPETPKPGDPVFEKVEQHLVGSLRLSLAAAKEAALAKGYNTVILSAAVEGEAREAAKVLAAVAREIRETGNPLAPPACVLAGGETTVTVRGGGTGGRNLEAALSAALALSGMKDVLFLSCGTDGADGPTNAAGTWVDGRTAGQARANGLSPEAFLAANDSYNFFKELKGLIVTGPTLTNVMDLMVILVR